MALYVWSGGAPSAFVELFDFTSNTSLARQDFTVVSTGPDWGSTWIRYNFTLVYELLDGAPLAPSQPCWRARPLALPPALLLPPPSPPPLKTY